MTPKHNNITCRYNIKHDITPGVEPTKLSNQSQEIRIHDRVVKELGKLKKICVNTHKKALLRLQHLKNHGFPRHEKWFSFFEKKIWEIRLSKPGMWFRLYCTLDKSSKTWVFASLFKKSNSVLKKDRENIVRWGKEAQQEG